MSITRSSALVLASCASLQFGAATAVGLFGPLGTWGVTFLRLSLAGALLLAVARPTLRSWSRGDWRAVVFFAVMMAAMNGFFYASLDRIPMSAAVAIEFIGPLVYAGLTSRRRGDLVWVGLAAAGMAVLGLEALSDATLDPVGMLLALIAGVFWVGYIVGSAAVGSRIAGTGGLAVAMLLGGLMLAPVGRTAVDGLTAEPWLLVPAVVTALLASVIPYSLELAALRRLPAAVFSVLISLEPAFAALAGFALLDQEMTAMRGVTIVLVIAASIGITCSAQLRTVRPPKEGRVRRPRLRRRTPSPQ
jgi:inner membrane transporter RhtA